MERAIENGEGTSNIMWNRVRWIWTSLALGRAVDLEYVYTGDAIGGGRDHWQEDLNQNLKDVRSWSNKFLASEHLKQCPYLEKIYCINGQCD